MYQWWLWAHIVFVGGFLLSHGASAAMGFRLRQEKSPDSIGTLTRLSKQTNNFTYAFLILIIISGISMGFQNNWWRFAWIWVALGLLIVTVGAMNGLGRSYHNVRVAAGVQAPRGRDRASAPNASPEPLEQVVAQTNPWPISLIGIVALLLLFWLMVIKPF